MSQERTITCTPLPLRHGRTCLRERSEGGAGQTWVGQLSREAPCLDIIAKAHFSCVPPPSIRSEQPSLILTEDVLAPQAHAACALMTPVHRLEYLTISFVHNSSNSHHNHHLRLPLQHLPIPSTSRSPTRTLHSPTTAGKTHRRASYLRRTSSKPIQQHPSHTAHHVCRARPQPEQEEGQPQQVSTLSPSARKSVWAMRDNITLPRTTAPPLL